MKLKVSVVTAPEGKESNILEDIKLMKVGLLYADEVSLCSPIMDIHSTFRNAVNLPYEKMFEHIKTIETIKGTVWDIDMESLKKGWEKYRRVKSKFNKTYDDVGEG